MDIETQTSRRLHDEHMTVKAFLERFGAELAGIRAGGLPDSGSRSVANLIVDLIAIVETELIAHFKFEEMELFPLLKSAGAADMTGLLAEEHDIILPLAHDLCELARTFRREGYAPESWNEFRQGGLELVERLSAHIDKEEMGLVPMIDTLLDPDKDDELMNSYAAMR